MGKHDGYLADGFRDVDNNTDVSKFEACLRFLEKLPSIETYKKKSIERLRLKQGDTALDLGCGLGFDVPKMARLVSPGGRSVGIDSSEKLLDSARRAFSGCEGVSFVQGDIHDLQIPSNSVNGIRVDRTLQHVRDPQKVISEMVRVLKPGGWLVCAEPDWSTFVIDADDNEVTNTVVRTWSGSFENPHIGRQLLRRVRSEGLENTWAEGFVLLADGLTAVDTVYDLYATVRRAKTENEEMSSAIDAWLNGQVRRDDHEGVIACVTIFLAGGQKCEYKDSRK
ncbi:methyltransferase domain-containing protein [Desulfomonile tiedjei]|uniref:Methylase involved in ubiquinone/menaquinone biosynthesis n=1 Tax=Desulfomonile tiedjei (strain ATCC 49306 / DSM 6799 / DCB-1) TaxID=706587 RepID=I4C4J2_DESTA|nr:methyltransferase domain-containing protein [Desulfomonile tiedjei]AFM24483.1 methylase involved in ubiquinone/menaquinone biosynthesis [Desulfomonile tiedjei DSM 6799]